MPELSLGDIAKVMNKWSIFAKRMKINPVLAAKMMTMHLESLGEKIPESLFQTHREEQDMKNTVVWKRFELIYNLQEKKLLELCDSKNLSRENLMLICSTVKIRELNVDNISKAKKYEPMEIREARKEAIANHIMEIFIENTMSAIASNETLALALNKVNANEEKLNSLYANQSPPYQV